MHISGRDNSCALFVVEVVNSFEADWLGRYELPNAYVRYSLPPAVQVYSGEGTATTPVVSLRCVVNVCFECSPWLA